MHAGEPRAADRQREQPLAWTRSGAAQRRAPNCYAGEPAAASLAIHAAAKLIQRRCVCAQTDEVPGDVEDIEAAATAPVFESEFESEDDKEDGSIAKQALMAEMSGGMGGPKPDKAAIGEILLALEARNPTPSPATSALLNGKWKVLYATGASPGLKALTLLLKGAEQVSSPPAPRLPRARPAPAPRPPRARATFARHFRSPPARRPRDARSPPAPRPPGTRSPRWCVRPLCRRPSLLPALS